MRQLISVLFILQLVMPVKAQNIDIDLLRKINLNRPVGLDGTCKVMSTTVTATSIAVPLTLLTVGKLSDNRTTLHNGLKSGLAITASMSVSTILKYVINRPRPYTTYPDIQRLSNDFTPSFPSGHTTSAFCTATSLTLMYPKWYVIVPAYSWAAFIGYSRMHLGMHYPFDVLAGAIIGTGISLVSFKVQRWIGQN
ncbi:MAG TPA: phosphatase PAP2 family protein [Bacteroidales bacterium]